MEFNDSVNIDAITKPADPVEVRKMLGWEGGVDLSTGTDEEEGDFGGFSFE
jgi:hypothetical protein